MMLYYFGGYPLGIKTVVESFGVYNKKLDQTYLIVNKYRVCQQYDEFKQTINT